MKFPVRVLIGSLAGVIILVGTAIITHQPKKAPETKTENPQVLGEAVPVPIPVPVRQDPVVPAKPTPPILPQPLDFSNVAAKSYLVYDVASGQNLADQNADSSLPIASLTKLMTGFVTYKNASLQEVAVISTQDVVDQTPALHVRPGDKIKLQDLFSAMLVGSANDAAQSLADYTADKTHTPFISLMNQAAQDLGMKDSHFSNPLGFDSDKNYSTAADLKILVDATRQYAAFSLTGRDTSYSFVSELGNHYSVKATNTLLKSDPEISAIKTGYTTDSAGSMITDVTHNGHSFIIIVLGSPDREGDTLKLKKEIIKGYIWQ